MANEKQQKLPSGSHAAEGKDNGFNACSDQIDTDECAHSEEGKGGLKQHQDTENQSGNVRNQ